MKAVPLLTDALFDPLPCFIFDAAKRLIFSVNGLKVNEPFPNNAVFVGYSPFAFDLPGSEDDWLLYINKTVRNIKNQHLSRIISRLYPNEMPRTSTLLCTTFVNTGHTNEELLRLIDLAECSDSDTREYIYTKLSDVGVVPIPDLESPNEIYCSFETSRDNTKGIKLIKRGWIRNTIVLRKSIICVPSEDQLVRNEANYHQDTVHVNSR